MISIELNIAYFILCVFLSFMINWLLLRFSKTLGVRNNDELNQVRWSSEVKPSLGGLSFFILFLISVAALGFIPDTIEQLTNNSKFIGILAASTLGFIIGLADDAYNTNPLVKFIGQLTCAFILIFSNLYIIATGNLVIDYLITVLWVVGLMNSINMLDNMDGITASISVVVLLGAVSFTLHSFPNSPALMLLLVGVLASLIGFLFFNWNPAKMYMGDTGSQFLGVFLAAISILLFWNERDMLSGTIQLKQFVLPLLVFMVPLMDTLTVFARRLMRKQSPFVGGKDHTTHQLVFFGFSERQAVLVLIFISLLSLLFAIALKFNWISWNFKTTLLAYFYFFIIFALMQLVYNKGLKNRNND